MNLNVEEQRGFKMASWLPTQEPDYIQRRRFTQLCELTVEGNSPEDNHIAEMYFDRATDMIYSKNIYSDRTTWSVTDPNCQGIFA